MFAFIPITKCRVAIYIRAKNLLNQRPWHAAGLKFRPVLNIGPTVTQFWDGVRDDGPALTQRWGNAPGQLIVASRNNLRY